ncbi:MAG TPA: DUF4286 family protein [Candidatus Paceibacterota bacterium]|nr:DUF4286 family protein [Candidatus Paceibacterota bacterium]
MKKLINTISVLIDRKFAKEWQEWMQADQMPRIVAAIGEGGAARLIKAKDLHQTGRVRFIISYEFPSEVAYTKYIGGKGREMAQRFSDKLNDRGKVSERIPGDEEFSVSFSPELLEIKG